MDSEDDEDLKKAIALSLQSQTPIDFDESTIPEPTLKGLAGQTRNTKVGMNTPDETTAIEGKPASACGIPGLNRKEDEQNRLARKRKAMISPPAPRKRPAEAIAPRKERIIDLTGSPAQKQCRRGVEEKAQRVRAGKEGDAGKASVLSLEQKPDTARFKTHPTSQPMLQYPRGAIKKTWAFGHERGGDIKIEEVLRKQDLNIAVLNMAKTKMIFVMQAKEEAVKQQYRRETSNMPNLRLCFPSMAGQINCMHSKLQLLFYKDRLRIVIPSANLVPYDWGEPGTMENTVFLIDLPRLNEENDAQEPLTLFGQELVYFLEAMGLQDDAIQGVLKFDFAETKHHAFVHTIGGFHTGETWRRTGYCGLGRAVKSLGLSCEGPLEVDFVTSSLGSLNDGFLQAIYLAAHGDDGMTEYNWRNARLVKARHKDGSREGTTAGKEEMIASLREYLHIYFPTQETVVNSKGGPKEAPSVFNPNGTLRRRFREPCYAIARAAGMMLFARPQSSANERCTPWAYVGSANLSESAWGRLSQDKASKAPKLMCRNWECGVLMSIPPSDAKQPVGMKVFETSVPVPMQFPGREYGASKPWFYANFQP